jgi:hypothetical protein
VTAPPPSVNPPTEQLDLLSSEIEGRLEAQAKEVEGLDRKSATALAATGVTLGLVINNADQFVSVLSGPRNVFYISLVLLASALICGVGCIWPREAKVVPAPRRLIEGYYAKSRDHTLAVLVSTRLRAFELNKNISKNKNAWLRWQLFLLGIGGAGLVAAFVGREVFK